MAQKLAEADSEYAYERIIPGSHQGSNPKVRTYCRITFCLYMAFFVYSSFTSHLRSAKENLFRVFVVLFCFFTMLGVSERRKYPFKVWLPSILKGITVTYALFLIFISQQNYVEARNTWNIIEPPVSQVAATKLFETWQSKCDLTLANLSNKLDRYSASHFFGWIVISFLIRDYYVMHMWAIGTELIELTFGQLMPHFAECWWDQLICDLIVTNIPGMIIGMTFLRYMKWEEFDWLGRKDKKSIKEWGIWTNHKKVLALFVLLFGFATQFMGSFFVPNAFHTSPLTNFNGCRLLIWFCIGIAAYKELYMYSSEPINQAMDVGGHFLQIALAVMFSEVTIIFKYYGESVVQFEGSLSLFRKIIWPLAIGIWAAVYLNARRYIPRKLKNA